VPGKEAAEGLSWRKSQKPWPACRLVGVGELLHEQVGADLQEGGEGRPRLRYSPTEEYLSLRPRRMLRTRVRSETNSPGQ